MIPFQVKIWTSSHGTARHYFPETLHKNFITNDYYLFPTIDAKPGRLTDEEFMENFLTDFGKISENVKRVNVLLMGDNDLRKDLDRGAFDLFSNTKICIEKHLDTRHALLVLGLIVSPYLFNLRGSHFNVADFKIEQEVRNLHSQEKGRNIGFSRTSTYFSNSHQNYFERDNTHLNKIGAQCLVDHMLKEIESFIISII
jgi:hypothetical protein